MTDRRPRLAPHFAPREFDCRNGVPWPPLARSGLLLLCRRVLEPLRDEYGVCTVTSGYRTVPYNASVGGAPRSYHLYNRPSGGEPAADIVFATGKPSQWARDADRLLRGIKHLHGGGLGIYPRFIHVDVRTGPAARW